MHKCQNVMCVNKLLWNYKIFEIEAISDDDVSNGSKPCFLDCSNPMFKDNENNFRLLFPHFIFPLFLLNFTSSIIRSLNLESNIIHWLKRTIDFHSSYFLLSCVSVLCIKVDWTNNTKNIPFILRKWKYISFVLPFHVIHLHQFIWSIQLLQYIQLKWIWSKCLINKSIKKKIKNVIEVLLWTISITLLCIVIIIIICSLVFHFFFSLSLHSVWFEYDFLSIIYSVHVSHLFAFSFLFTLLLYIYF